MTRTDQARLDNEVYCQFTGEAEQFQVLNSSVGQGMLLGQSRTGRAVRVQLLRPVPNRIVVVGEARLASILAIRAAVLGATIVIATERPAPWNLLVQSIAGQRPFATVSRPDSLTLPAPTIAAPLLVLHDSSAVASESVLARSAWQTSLHLVFRLNPQLSSLLESSDLTLLPRPAEEEVEATLELLRLPPELAAGLDRMGENEYLAITRNRAQFVRIDPTASEQNILR
ncbi:hypothetical protein SAMN05892883_1786 [Jatrophihabitans sp. GAS493]|uniref:hypothetical protein n=1 Tax=Jatrophihabitans sp. GAS493 TaxID=1907575 RepID=UPI000BB99128|nr:hypothetical protein [Jatrophihabitans sp. GAS493]SOD72387.1 hypothetical protein SAMN05892883_1786 [Jatrophihabitans sp. GAS493]